MLTEKDYCDYDTCVILKKLGYDRGAYAYYFPNHKEDLIFNTHQMRGCSINEMLKAYNTYSKDTIGCELIDAPTLWEAQKWLRDKNKLHITIFSSSQESWMYRITKPHQKLEDGIYAEDFVSYEEALLEGIKTSVKYLNELRGNIL